VPIFGRYAVPRWRKVLIIEEEDNPGRTATRLKALLAGYGFTAAQRLDIHQRSDLAIACYQGFRLDERRWVPRFRPARETCHPEITYAERLPKITRYTLGKPE